MIGSTPFAKKKKRGRPPKNQARSTRSGQKPEAKPCAVLAAPASVVDVDDAEDDIPLKGLRTVQHAQKIVDDKRKEEEAPLLRRSLVR